MSEHLVFVYGTLKRGFGNHKFLEHSRFIGDARTCPALFMVDGGVPFVMIEGGPLRQIAGEVYAVDKPTLRRLDRLEGHPHMYRRETVEVVVDGNRRNAFIYMMPRALLGDAAEIENHCYVWKGYAR